MRGSSSASARRGCCSARSAAWSRARSSCSWWGRAALGCVVPRAFFLFVVVSVGGLPLWALLVPMFAIVSSLAFVMPNATALALADHPEVAGTASALLGVIQFLVGAIAAPLVGVAGPDSAVPMGVVMVVLALGALTAQRAAARRRPWRLAR